MVDIFHQNSMPTPRATNAAITCPNYGAVCATMSAANCTKSRSNLGQVDSFVSY